MKSHRARKQLGSTVALLVATLGISSPATTAQRTPPATVRTALSTDGLRPGGVAKAAVQLVIAPEYHVNSRFPTDEFLVPTKLELMPPKGIKTGAAVYPRGVVRTFKFSKEAISVYQGTISIIFPVTAAATLKPGREVIRGRLTYQACTDEICLPPQTADVEIPVDIVPAGTPTPARHPEIFSRKTKRR
jgi:thioredoxin:protein disulfide reductase